MRRFKLLTTVTIYMAMVLCISCKKDDVEPSDSGSTNTVATVTTNEVTELTATTAICGGEVKSENGWAVTERGVCWSTNQNPTLSDSRTVDGKGLGNFTSEITGLEPDTKYYVRAYAKNAAGTSFGAERIFTTQSGGGGGGDTGDHEYVDLGLPSGLLWATCNVGADSPEDYGSYYAWGETETKSYYDWSTYKWCNGSNKTLTKYCTDSDYGTVDNRTVLERADDAAHVNWGGGWRLPTSDELRELSISCTWECTMQCGKHGYRITGTNGKSIFLPTAGYYYDGKLVYAGFLGQYWSSSLCVGVSSGAYYMKLESDFVGVAMNSSGRSFGQSIRPVCPSKK